MNHHISHVTRCLYIYKRKIYVTDCVFQFFIRLWIDSSFLQLLAESQKVFVQGFIDSSFEVSSLKLIFTQEERSKL